MCLKMLAVFPDSFLSGMLASPGKLLKPSGGIELACTCVRRTNSYWWNF